MTIALKKRSNRLRALSAAAAMAVGLLAQPGSATAEVLPAINLQLTPWTVIAREKGIFKEEFTKVGTKEVNLIASGGAELVGAETGALSKGAISIAQRMIYPATVHRANGLDGVIIWASETSNRYRAPILAAVSNKSVNTLADLDGKKFGSSRISCYWSAPTEALNSVGLPLDTRQTKGRVRYESIDSPTVAIAAVISGALDATTTHLAAGNATGAWLSGKLKVIGVTSAQPSPAVPGAVPLNKFVPGYVQDINFALWAPPGTPADVAAKLTETVRKGLSAPGMAEKFVAFSVPLAVAGPDEVTRITTRESNNIKKIMETVPIKFE